MLLVPLPVHAGESVIIFPCGPIERFHEAMQAHHEALTDLSPEQFQFARGIFATSPETPASLPPGDRAVMATREDGTVSLIFIDGDQACAPLRLTKLAIDLLLQVGRGEIVHSGHPL